MPDPTRRLWQVPTFLIGLASFLTIYMGWIPLGARDPAGTYRSDLAALQGLGSRPNPDLGELKARLASAAAAIESFPENAAPAHFLVGAGYMRLAELTPEPADAQTYWTLAKQHFEAVKSEQLTDPLDAPRLAYRFAKCRAALLNTSATQPELDRLRHLLLAVPIGESAGEGHRLAAEIAMRLAPQDLLQAKNSYTAYIAETGLATPPASIARAKLKLSEVHRLLGDVDGAKKWLAQIGTDAPADVLPTAKAQLARIRMDEGDFVGARRDWEVLLLQPNAPTSLKSMATYQIGMCLLNGKPRDEEFSAKRFEESMKGEGPEGPASAIRLAELRLKSVDAARRKDMAALLAFAVKGIAKPGDYPNNALVPIQDVRAAFEAAVQTLTTDGAFEQAVAAAEAYRFVASAGRDKEKRAEALAAWGHALQRAGSDPAAKYSAAAEDYSALARLRTEPTDQADLYRKAAGLYKQAGSVAAAIGIYEQTLKLPKLPDEILGPLWIDYAESLLVVNRPEDALKALQGSLLTAGPAANTARYRIARWLIDSRVAPKVELGVDLMDQIAKAETVPPAEQDMHERSLVDVANAYIQKGNFEEAEARLQKQVKLYPNGVEASLGRLLLGVALLQRADPRAKTQAANPAKNRDEALVNFKQVMTDVEARAKDGKAADRDPWLKVQANLRVLQTYQQQSKPYDVLKDGDVFRREVAGTADELIVLSLMYHAYKQLDKPEGMFTIHGQMKDAFEKMKDKPNVFHKPTGEYSREYWEKVWFAPETPKKP